VSFSLPPAIGKEKQRGRKKDNMDFTINNPSCGICIRGMCNCPAWMVTPMTDDMEMKDRILSERQREANAGVTQGPLFQSTAVRDVPLFDENGEIVKDRCLLLGDGDYVYPTKEASRDEEVVLGYGLKDLWKKVNKQTSRSMLDPFKQGDNLCMTLFSGGKYYDMSTKDWDRYFVKKARDVDNGIPYFDNQFVSTGACRLALEFDLKTKCQLENWQDTFAEHSKLVCQLARAWFDGDDCEAHTLVRKPYQKSIGACTDGDWKYGMHLIFENIVVDVDEGENFTDACKDLFPDHDDGYVDNVYTRGVARLRPAYGRKIDRHGRKTDPKGQFCTGSYFYDYAWSVDHSGEIVTYEFSTLDVLRKTSLIKQ
jgi:hypothetical protein